MECSGFHPPRASRCPISLTSQTDDSHLLRLFDGYTPAEEDVAVSQFQAFSQRSKKLHNELVAMLQSSVEELWRISCKMMPVYLGRNLASLPDELLADILELSESDPMELRMVSRRFNQVITHLPHLWTEIHPYMPRKRQEFALELSRQHTLDVKAYLDRSNEDFLDRMTLHWNRTGRLSLDFDLDDESTVDERLAKSQMPSLQYLRIDCGPRGASEEGDDVRQCTFFDGWFAPKLTSIVARNEIPPAIRGMNLKDLSIQLDTPTTVVTDLSRLSTLLDASPLLEHLTFLFKKVGTGDTEFERVEMYHLKYFKLIVATGPLHDIDDNPWTQIVGDLIMPNLEEFHVETIMDDTDDLERFLSDTFSSQFRYPNVHTLDLTIKRTIDSRELMDIILSHIPKLRHVHLELPGIELIGNNLVKLQDFPPLETIVFRRMYRCEPRFFLKVFRVVYGKNEAEFTSGERRKFPVKFVGCSHLKKDSMGLLARRYFDIHWED